MKKFFRILLASFLGTFVALLICTFIMFGMFSSMLSSGKTTPVVPASAILKIDFKENIAEQTTDDMFASFNPMNPVPTKTVGILQIIQSIERAAEDPAIKFIYLNTTNINGALSHVEEIRTALERFRLSGKPVVAYSDSYQQGSYYLASVADKIYVNPASMNLFTGMSVNMLFFKDLLDKLGIEMQLIRYGRYKAGAEQFVNSNISPENREQNRVMIASIWGTMLEGISASRGISVEKFNSLVDNLELMSAESLLENNMVDGLMHIDEMDQYLCGLFNVDKAKDLKFISLSDYHTAREIQRKKTKSTDKIAVLYANGEIVGGNGDAQIAGERYARMIAKIREDKNIKAVVLRVNSPGGSADAAKVIKRELDLLAEAKPLVVSMGSYAASGGYWISANAEKIYTDKTTLTGSIGVFSLIPNIGPGLKKHLNINVSTINTNKHSDMFSGYRSFDKVETAFFKKFTDETYVEFLDVVSTGRSMETKDVDKIGEGRVWTGANALENGLVDEIGGLIDALRYTEISTGLTDYRLVQYPTPKTSMERLMESLNSTKAVIDAIASPEEAVIKMYSKIEENGTPETLARLPYFYIFNY